MGALLKLVLGFAGGPAAWWATAVGWVYDGLAWCAKHWKITLAVVAALVILFYGYAAGLHHGRADLQAAKKATAEAVANTEKVQGEFDAYKKQREAEDARVNAEHTAAVVDLKKDTADIEKKAKADAAARTAEYNKIKKELDGYVRNHSKPEPAGSCPTDTDIGDDGLHLIATARAARIPGASPGH